MPRRLIQGSWLMELPAMSRSQPRGFTLVELLAVVSIIAILLSLLLPAMEDAFGIARNAACLNNERLIGLAFFQYRQDHRDYLPQGLENSTWGGGGTFYDERLVPYCTAKPFFCPGMGGPMDYNFTRGYGYSNAFIYSGWQNALPSPIPIGLMNNSATSQPVKFQWIAQPGGTIVLGDRNWATWVGYWEGADLWYKIDEDYAKEGVHPNPHYESNTQASRRHGSLKSKWRDRWINYLMLDSHAEGIHPIETYTAGNGQGSQNLWDFD